MRVKYDQEADVLTIETGRGKIDHAEEMGPFVVHFTEKDKPVLLEILNASRFLSALTRSVMKAPRGKFVEIGF